MLTKAAVKVIEQSGVKISWEIVRMGAEVIEEINTPISSYVLKSIKKIRLHLKGM
ncbi:hypothetical protein [Clostridium sp.]|jgi:isocitrate dehydrogenase (NAD+)|uniref:hypothetical protein n=1 Tax=Clostridium sp. TaxID=1506 RepID=UPI003EE88E8A